MLWFDLELCRSQTNKGAYSFVVTQREKWTVESLRLEGSGLPEPDRALLVTGSVPLFSSHPSKRWAWVGARLHFVAVCVRNWGSPWRASKATGEGRTGHCGGRPRAAERTEFHQVGKDSSAAEGLECGESEREQEGMKMAFVRGGMRGEMGISNFLI